MKTKKLLLLISTLTLALTFSVLSAADIPRVISFQGKATSADGTPLNSDENHQYKIGRAHV